MLRLSKARRQVIELMRINAFPLQSATENLRRLSMHPFLQSKRRYPNADLPDICQQQIQYSRHCHRHPKERDMSGFNYHD
jgi:hypothetical protein